MITRWQQTVKEHVRNKNKKRILSWNTTISFWIQIILQLFLSGAKWSIIVVDNGWSFIAGQRFWKQPQVGTWMSSLMRWRSSSAPALFLGISPSWRLERRLYTSCSRLDCRAEEGNTAESINQSSLRPTHTCDTGDPFTANIPFQDDGNKLKLNIFSFFLLLFLLWKFSLYRHYPENQNSLRRLLYFCNST